MYRTLTTVTAAACLLLAAAPAADAAATRSFDFRTSTGIHGGQAHAWGNATFRSGGRATITGRLNDVCPQDGLGAYLDVWVFFRGDAVDRFYAKDIQGCSDPDGVAFSFSVDGLQPVTGMRLILHEEDADGSKVGEERWLHIDNPQN